MATSRSLVGICGSEQPHQQHAGLVITGRLHEDRARMAFAIAALGCGDRQQRYCMACLMRGHSVVLLAVERGPDRRARTAAAAEGIRAAVERAVSKTRVKWTGWCSENGARRQASVEEHDSPALTRTPFCWFSPLMMTHPIRCAMLLSIAVAFPAAAQTTATPGTVTQSGVVNLGTGATSGATAPPAVSTKGAAATGSAAGSSAAGVGSRAGGLANAGSSTSSQSSAGSISGGASTSPVIISAPHWVLCAPSGASGEPPFFTGTNLSCAP